MKKKEILSFRRALEDAFRRNRVKEILEIIEKLGEDLSKFNGFMVYAVLTNNKDIVQAFIKAGDDVNLKTPSGRPVQVAARNGNLEIIEMLIAAGADINTGNLIGNALSNAIEHGHEACACRLIEAGAKLFFNDKPLLFQAIFKKQSKVVQAAIKQKAELNFTEDCFEYNLETGRPEYLYQNATPLILAAGEGQLDIVKQLVQAKADLNRMDDNGKTALKVAEEKGHQEIVDYLKETGAVEVVTVAPETQLFLAIEKKELKTVETLLQNGVDSNSRDVRKKTKNLTPLILAIKNNNLKAVELLLKFKANVNLRDDESTEKNQGLVSLYSMSDLTMVVDSRALLAHTPLMHACYQGNLAIVKLLLAAKATIDPIDKLGFNALALAVNQRHHDIVKLLIEAGADINVRLPGRSTPIHDAIDNDDLASVKALISAGAKLDLKNSEGNTPIHLAIIYQSQKTIKVLLEAGVDVTLKNQQGEDAKILSKENPFNKENQNLLKIALEKAKTDSKGKKETTKEKKGLKFKKVNLKDLEKKYDFKTVFKRLKSEIQKPFYQEVVEEIGKRCGSKPKKRIYHEEEFEFFSCHVNSSKKLDTLKIQQEFLKKGCFVFNCNYQFNTDAPGELAVLPTTDFYDALVVMGTNGANYDLGTIDVIKGLMELEQVQPFQLDTIEGATLAGKFKEKVKDPSSVAKWMYDFCPDIVDQGCGEEEILAESLADNKNLYFWWD